MEINTIQLGDAYELIKTIPDKSIDLIVTDPPYLLEGNKSHGIATKAYDEVGLNENLAKGIINQREFLEELFRICRKTNIYIWCNKEQIYDYMTFFVEEKGCNFEFIIWAKADPIPFCGGHYLKDKEYCLYFWETGARCRPTFDTARSVYITNKNTADKALYDHPTIKPQNIIENLITNSSVKGGLILDPFMGSGTTACAAKALGRNFVGFEIDPKYHKIATDRLNGITQKEVRQGYKQESLFDL